MICPRGADLVGAGGANMRWTRAVAGLALAALLALGAGSVSAHAGGGVAGKAHWTVVASGARQPW